MFWADGANHENGTDSDYFGSKEFLAWLYNSSPIKDKVIVQKALLMRYEGQTILCPTVIIFKLLVPTWGMATS